MTAQNLLEHTLTVLHLIRVPVQFVSRVPAVHPVPDIISITRFWHNKTEKER